MTLIAPGNLIQSGSSPYNMFMHCPFCQAHACAHCPTGNALLHPYLPRSFFPSGHLKSQIAFSQKAFQPFFSLPFLNSGYIIHSRIHSSFWAVVLHHSLCCLCLLFLWLFPRVHGGPIVGIFQRKSLYGLLPLFIKSPTFSHYEEVGCVYMCTYV